REEEERRKERGRGKREEKEGERTRQKMKRQSRDQRDERDKFETPNALVDAEYNGIGSQGNKDLAQSGKTCEDEDTTEE
ncbi:trigger factor, partial [Rhizobium leguminosarum]